MPLIAILRFLFMLVSLAIIAASAYLLWQWYDGDIVQRGDGVAVRVREDWYLWLGGALLMLSLLGRPIITPFLAKRDTDPSKPERSAGRMITGGSGAQLYVEETGPVGAPVVILTHGWAMDSTIW